MYVQRLNVSQGCGGTTSVQHRNTAMYSSTNTILYTFASLCENIALVPSDGLRHLTLISQAYNIFYDVFLLFCATATLAAIGLLASSRQLASLLCFCKMHKYLTSAHATVAAAVIAATAVATAVTTAI